MKEKVVTIVFLAILVINAIVGLVANIVRSIANGGFIADIVFYGAILLLVSVGLIVSIEEYREEKNDLF